RLRVSRLRFRRDTAHLDEPEAEAKHGTENLRRLVETGCKAHRIGKIEPPYARCQDRIGNLVDPKSQACGEPANGYPMRGLRRRRAHHRPAPAKCTPPPPLPPLGSHSRAAEAATLAGRPRSPNLTGSWA